MIIEALLTLIHWLLDLLMTPIDIPDLPQGVSLALSRMYSYLADGLGIFAAFTHYQFIMSLFAIVVFLFFVFCFFLLIESLWQPCGVR